MKYIWRIDCIRSLFVSLQVWQRVHSTKNSTWCRASCERTKDVAQQRRSYCAFKMSSNVVCQAPFYRNPKKRRTSKSCYTERCIYTVNKLFIFTALFLRWIWWLLLALTRFIVYRTINTKHLGSFSTDWNTITMQFLKWRSFHAAIKR